MEKLDRITLSRQSKELGFVRDTYEKVCRLTEILRYLSSEETLAHSLALKGGTAINLTIFDLPRLSVDIDLDFTRNLSRDEMMSERALISNRLLKKMNADGYVLSSKTKVHHALDSFVFEYINSGGARDNIKVEINYMLRCHILKPATRLSKSLWEPEGIQTLCVHPVEIFGSKITALLNRTAPRDLYDIRNLIQLSPLEGQEIEVLRKCIVFYNAIASDSPWLESPLVKLDELPIKKIKSELLPVLRKGENFQLTEAKIMVRDWLGKILTLSEREQEFLQYFKQKEYKPDLLFDDPEIIERIKNHPMALWKCSDKGFL